MRNLKIIYFIPSLSNAGGMERVLTQKVNYLAGNMSYDISIITTDMKDEDNPFFPLNQNIKLYKFKLFFNDDYNKNFINKFFGIYKKNIQYKIMLENLLLDKDADFLISMGGKELEFLCRLNHPAKKIYEAHFSNGIHSRKMLENKGNGLFWKTIAHIREKQFLQKTKKLDALVVLTEKSKRDWEKTNNNVYVIPNPSSIKIAEHCYDLSSKRVISLGRLEYEKGFDLLIKAWVSVNSIYPKWKLDIYGAGSLEESLAEMILQLNLSDSVKLCGTTKNVATEMKSSSFYVLSSRYEGLPLVMLESLACSLPIVAFDCETGPSDIIENNDCGFLAKNGDIDDLSIQMIKMIEIHEIRLELSKNCNYKAKKYAVENIMLIWDDLFNSLSSSSV